MAVAYSFLLRATVAGCCSTALEETVTIGVLRLTKAVVTTYTASTSIVTIRACTTASVATVKVCAQS